jgi:epoxyqueuosine reductase
MRKAPSVSEFHAAARQAGFLLSGVARALPHEDYLLYRQWLADGMAGPMRYLADGRGERRADPRQLLPSARSVLCVGKLYKTKDIEVQEGCGKVSRYAWGTGDYHDVVRRALEGLVRRLKEAWGDFEHRVAVDTAPLLERSYARAAGLGWIGRNTCLINQRLGSWFFLGEILVPIELPPGAPPPDRCGTCTRCIDACPTRALVPGPGPVQWRLDGRLCISTLTIEQRGAFPEPLRAPAGRHVFGCDICQEVCPWNARAPSAAEVEFHPANAAPDLAEMADLAREDFRERFRRTPVWRAKYEGFLRNVATAMGNSADRRHIPALRRLAAHPDRGVAEHARWALARLEERP